MKIAIRCDAGGSHGLGHASRMQALARALAAAGAEIAWWTTSRGLRTFLGDDPLAQTIEYLPVAAWDLAPIADSAPAVLVMDHTGAYPTAVLRRLRQRLRVVRVDHPYADPESCDLLILPNVHQAPAHVAKLSEEFNGRLCYGAPYILLAAAAATWSHWRYPQEPPLLYCTAGGSDPTRALEALMTMTAALSGPLPQLRCVFGLGAARATPVTIRELPPQSVLMRHDPATMARASLVLTTFGVTVYEALYLGVPALTVATSEVHAEGSRQLMETVQATVDLGRMTTLAREDLCATIQDLLADVSCRCQMSALGRQLVDAKGAQRCAESILGLL